MHVLVPHAAIAAGKSGLWGEAVGESLGCLASSWQTWARGQGAYQNPAVFLCSLAFVYIILPLILLGGEIPSKKKTNKRTVAYSYQAMS